MFVSSSYHEISKKIQIHFQVHVASPSSIFNLTVENEYTKSSFNSTQSLQDAAAERKLKNVVFLVHLLIRDWKIIVWWCAVDEEDSQQTLVKSHDEFRVLSDVMREHLKWTKKKSRKNVEEISWQWRSLHEWTQVAGSLDILKRIRKFLRLL